MRTILLFSPVPNIVHAAGINRMISISCRTEILIILITLVIPGGFIPTSALHIGETGAVICFISTGPIITIICSSVVILPAWAKQCRYDSLFRQSHQKLDFRIRRKPPTSRRITIFLISSTAGSRITIPQSVRLSIGRCNLHYWRDNSLRIFSGSTIISR